MSFNVLVKFLLSFVLFVRLCQCHGLTLLPPEVLDWRRRSVSSSCRSCHSRVIHGSPCKIRESHVFLWHTCVSMYTQPSYSILVSHSVQMRHSLNPRVIPRCRVISLLLRSLTIIIIIIIIIITIVIIIFVAYLHICKAVLCQFYFVQPSVLLAWRMRNLGLSWAILDILSRTCAFFGSLLLASIMRWWGMRFCELCSLSSYYVFRVETSLRRLHDNSIVEFPNWHVPGANGLGNQTTISQQTHCGEIMCRILILLCVCTEHSVSRSARLCLSSCISKRVILQTLQQCVFPCLTDVYSMWTYLNSDPASLSHIDYGIHLSYFLLSLPLS